MEHMNASSQLGVGKFRMSPKCQLLPCHRNEP